MWAVIWFSTPHPQPALSIPHMKSEFAHLPCPVLILLSLTYVTLGNWKPSGFIVGSFTGKPLVGLWLAHSAFHVLLRLKPVVLNLLAVFRAGLLDFSLVDYVALLFVMSFGERGYIRRYRIWLFEIIDCWASLRDFGFIDLITAPCGAATS